MSHARYLVGDVFERLAEIPDGSIDLVLTSPPFLALRSYLPDDHPDKHKEIGSEATPAEFLTTLLHLTAAWRRVLAPHGSIAVELGDTYAGSGGAGGDYAEGGMREGQPMFRQGYVRNDRPGRVAQLAPKDLEARRPGRPDGRRSRALDEAAGVLAPRSRPGPEGRDEIDGWPMDKCMAGIPHLYHLSLAYGMNLLTGEPSPAGRWRVRNVVAWCRPNPPVGATGDKYRPATSYMTVATLARTRYFDTFAVRVQASPNTNARTAKGIAERANDTAKNNSGGNNHKDTLAIQHSHETRPPYDHVGLMADEIDIFTEEAWLIATHGYPGAHYATWPPALCTRPIRAMVPQRVCTTCGEPSRRIVKTNPTGQNLLKPDSPEDANKQVGAVSSTSVPSVSEQESIGWTDCGHDSWRSGLVLDPFAGSGTTLAVATGEGRDAIGIDLDERNADLARERVGMFLDVEEHAAEVSA